MGCSECRLELKTISEHYGEEFVYFYELSGVKGGEWTIKVEKIYEIAFPQKIQMMPLVGVFFNGQLVAVLAGYHDGDFLKSLEKKFEPNSVLLYYRGEQLGSVKGEEAKIIEELFLSDELHSMRSELGRFVLLAATDSVNPCTFIVFAALLVLSMATGGKEMALKTGISFILTVFLCYFLLGIGLFSISLVLKRLIPLLSSGLIALGSFEIRSFLRGIHKAPLPRFLKTITLKHLERFEVAAGPLESMILGSLISFTLLPCSMGPYLIAASFLAGSGYSRAIFMLLLYNVIFILPLMVILMAVWSGLRLKVIKKWVGTKVTVMDFISGVLLLSIGFYFLATGKVSIWIRVLLALSGLIIPILDLERIKSPKYLMFLIYLIGLSAAISLIQFTPLIAIPAFSTILISMAFWVRGRIYFSLFLLVLTCLSILWISFTITKDWEAKVVVKWPDGSYVELPQYSCGCHGQSSSADLRLSGRPRALELQVILKEGTPETKAEFRWNISLNGIEVWSGEVLVSQGRKTISNITTDVIEEMMSSYGIRNGSLDIYFKLKTDKLKEERFYKDVAVISLGKEGFVRSISWRQVLPSRNIMKTNLSGWLALATVVFSMPLLFELKQKGY